MELKDEDEDGKREVVKLYFEGGAEPDLSRDDIDWLLGENESSFTNTYIVKERKKIIGAATWDWKSSTRAELSIFTIAKEWQRNGIGRYLFEESLKKIKVLWQEKWSCPLNSVLIQTSKENKVAHEFYRKLPYSFKEIPDGEEVFFFLHL